MVQSTDFQRALELLDKSSRVLITTHTRVDGDAVGCCMAMAAAVRAMGRQAQVLFLSEVPRWYEFLVNEQVPVLGEGLSAQDLAAGKLGSFDLLMIVDTNSLSQLDKINIFLKANDRPVLVIDHHETSDHLGDVEIVDTGAAATSLVVMELFRHTGWQITRSIAEALFVGVATDTGWFHFNNTDARVYRACADLVEAGVNTNRLYRQLYQTFSVERFRLLAVLLASLELQCQGRCATVTLRQDDFERTGAEYADTENLIDECQRIATVEVAAMFVEAKDGKIRCSLRSRNHVDVRKIAQKFGGGGHTSAAGAHLDGPLEKAKALIQKEVAAQLDRQGDQSAR